MSEPLSGQNEDHVTSNTRKAVPAMLLRGGQARVTIGGDCLDAVRVQCIEQRAYLT